MLSPKIKEKILNELTESLSSMTKKDWDQFDTDFENFMSSIDETEDKEQVVSSESEPSFNFSADEIPNSATTVFITNDFNFDLLGFIAA